MASLAQANDYTNPIACQRSAARPLSAAFPLPDTESRKWEYWLKVSPSPEIHHKTQDLGPDWVRGGMAIIDWEHASAPDGIQDDRGQILKR